MFYFYLIKSKKTNKLYIGCSEDLKSRIESHNKGLNKSTKSGIPWELIYYEAYKNLSLARKREVTLKKYGQGFRRLKERLGF